MQFLGPDPSDFRNVRALNREFTALIRRPRSFDCTAEGRGGGIRDALSSLCARQLDYLAGVPFLLFSLAEDNAELWQRRFGSDGTRDLFAASESADAAAACFVAAGTGFAWQLARRNPYALRLVSGASMHWCEELASRPLVQVINAACTDGGVLGLRGLNTPGLWEKLLTDGVHDDERVRSAAHASAWHMLLSRPVVRRRATLAAAACRTRVPTLTVADDRRR